MVSSCLFFFMAINRPSDAERLHAHDRKRVLDRFIHPQIRIFLEETITANVIHVRQEFPSQNPLHISFKTEFGTLTIHFELEKNSNPESDILKTSFAFDDYITAGPLRCSWPNGDPEIPLAQFFELVFVELEKVLQYFRSGSFMKFHEQFLQCISGGSQATIKALKSVDQKNPEGPLRTLSERITRNLVEENPLFGSYSYAVREMVAGVFGNMLSGLTTQILVPHPKDPKGKIPLHATIEPRDPLAWGISFRFDPKIHEEGFPPEQDLQGNFRILINLLLHYNALQSNLQKAVESLERSFPRYLDREGEGLAMIEEGVNIFFETAERNPESTVSVEILDKTVKLRSDAHRSPGLLLVEFQGEVIHSIRFENQSAFQVAYAVCEALATITETIEQRMNQGIDTSYDKDFICALRGHRDLIQTCTAWYKFPFSTFHDFFIGMMTSATLDKGLPYEVKQALEKSLRSFFLRLFIGNPDINFTCELTLHTSRLQATFDPKTFSGSVTITSSANGNQEVLFTASHETEQEIPHQMEAFLDFFTNFCQQAMPSE